MRIGIILLATALAGSVAFAPAALPSSAEQAQDQGTGSDNVTLVENGSEPPVISDDTFADGSWGAYRVTVEEGSKVTLDSEPTMKDARRSVKAAWLLNSDGSHVIGFLATGYTGGSSERHVEVEGNVIVSERSGGTNGPGGQSVTWEFKAPKEYILLAVATSDEAVASRLRLYGDDSVNLLAKTIGVRTFVYAESDFRGTANVTVTEPCVLATPVCPTAKALVDQSVSVEVGSRLFGNFETSIDPAVVRSWEGPDTSGSRDGMGSITFTNESPGTYRFNVDANVGGPLSGITVWGADVDLPEPLRLTDEGFAPDSVTVGQGWVLQLSNQGELVHNFSVEGQGIDIDVAPGESVGQPLPLPPGRYSIRDTYHPGISGELVVRAS